MNKVLFSFVVIILIAVKANAQDFIADSLKSVIENTKSDSVKASALIALAGHEYSDLNNHDTAVIVLNSALSFAKERGLVEQEVGSMALLSGYNYDNNDSIKGHQLALQAISLAREHHLNAEEVNLLLHLSYHLNSKPDSVKLLMAQALNLSMQYNMVEQQIRALKRKGDFYAANKPDSAKSYYWQGIALAHQSHLPKSEVSLLRTMAFAYSNNHWGDSAKYFMQEALRVARENHLADLEINLLGNLIQSERGFFLKDSLIPYYERMLSLSRQMHSDSLSIMVQFGVSISNLGNFPISIRTLLTALHASEERKDSFQIEGILNLIGQTYMSAKDFNKSIDYYRQSIKFGNINQGIYNMDFELSAYDYLELKQYDSARYFADKAVKLFGSSMPPGVSDDLGLTYFGLAEDSVAIYYLRMSYTELSQSNSHPSNYAEVTAGLANYFKKAEMVDSSFYYAKLCFNTSQSNGNLQYISESSDLIADYYNKKHDADSAYHYQQIGFEAYKSLYGEENSRQLQNMSDAEQQREQDVEKAKKIAADQYRSRLNTYLLLGGLMILVILAFGLWRRNIYKQKSFALLQKQKHEIDLQKSKLEISLNELKTTQSQLIQSEKMASLGDLTAGIAHEIQNPLNFVNNFSEVNRELIDEMQREMDSGNNTNAKAISNDIKGNE